MVFDLPRAYVVAIYELVEFRRQAVEELLDGRRELLHLAYARVRRGDVPPEGLDVDIYFDHAVAQLANLFFQIGCLTMRLAQAQVFVNLQVQFNEELAILLHGGQIVNGEPQALRRGADGFE